MTITTFDWLPSIRKAFVIPNKIHRTNLLASTYTLVQGISRWSARIEIKGLCLSLWVLNNGTMLTHTKNMLLNDTSTDVISSQNMFSWKCICKVASLLFCWRLIFMSGVQNGETFKNIFLTSYIGYSYWNQKGIKNWSDDLFHWIKSFNYFASE